MSKKVLLVACLIGAMLLVACGTSTDLANGQNYYCPDESFVDIVQTEPELQVRFTCNDANKKFEVTFGGPNDSKLVDLLRDKNVAVWVGVVLVDDEVVQFYEVLTFGNIQTHWRADN